METPTQRTDVPFSLDFGIEVPPCVEFEQGAMGRDTQTYNPDGTRTTDDD